MRAELIITVMAYGSSRVLSALEENGIFTLFSKERSKKHFSLPLTNRAVFVLYFLVSPTLLFLTEYMIINRAKSNSVGLPKGKLSWTGNSSKRILILSSHYAGISERIDKTNFT